MNCRQADFFIDLNDVACLIARRQADNEPFAQAVRDGECGDTFKEQDAVQKDSLKKYTSDFEPSLKCKLCPRLVRYREDNNSTYPKFHNAPVPSFSD